MTFRILERARIIYQSLLWLRNFLVAKEPPHGADKVLEHITLVALFFGPHQCLTDNFWDFLRVVARMQAKGIASSSKTRRVHFGREIVLEFMLQRSFEMRVAIANEVTARWRVELIVRFG